MKRAAAALVSIALAAGAAFAQDEDYTPDFGALEGAELSHVLTRNFDEYALPVGRFTREDKPSMTVEGRVREFVYRLDGETSTLEAIRNYERRFEELGYRALFSCATDACGGFDFRFGTYLVEPPAMRFDLADFRYLGVAGPEGARHASVIASRQGGGLYVQIITVEGEDAPDRMTEANAPAPRRKPGQAWLFEIARRLTDEGAAPLEGVEFEPGSAVLTEGSGPVLEQVAEILRGRPDLTFYIVGHTDDQGPLETNMALSLARAGAVADRLGEIEGVDAAHLAPYGVAFLSPRASNATPEGRALNRRVELVIK